MADLERALESLSVSADERNALLAQILDRSERSVRLSEDRKSEAMSGPGGSGGSGGGGAGAGGGKKSKRVGGLRGFAADAGVAATNPFQSAFSAGVEKARAGLSALIGDRPADAAINLSGGAEKIFEIQSAEAQTRGIVQRLTAVTGKAPSEDQIKGIFGQARQRAERVAEANRAVTSTINKTLPEDLAKEVLGKLSGILNAAQRQAQATEEQNQRMGGS